jgi:hypothetical protein
MKYGIHICFIVWLTLGLTSASLAKQDTGIVHDSLVAYQKAIYNRPFIGLGSTGISLGGYVEGNTNYFVEDGLTEGFSMEMRRVNLFVYSPIGKRLKYLMELEFEHGTEEIALETAQIDFEISKYLSFRSGIILPQIGVFNANHDSPVWDFVDRPLSSTMIIPSTLSEVGFGLFGNMGLGSGQVSYDFYVVNGLNAGIVLNDQGRTFIPGGKSPEMFEEDNNGMPMYNARVAWYKDGIGEVGVSYYGGVYNDFRLEGEEIAERNSLAITAIDFNTDFEKVDIKGEYVIANIDVEESLQPLYGTRQQGGFVEVDYSVLRGRIIGFDHANLLLMLRFEKVDMNVGDFKSPGIVLADLTRYDHETALSGGMAFRPNGRTVFKVNYRYHWIRDLVGNPAARMAGIQVGIATYF